MHFYVKREGPGWPGTQTGPREWAYLLDLVSNKIPQELTVLRRPSVLRKFIDLREYDPVSCKTMTQKNL